MNYDDDETPKAVGDKVVWIPRSISSLPYDDCLKAEFVFTVKLVDSTGAITFEECGTGRKICSCTSIESGSGNWNQHRFRKIEQFTAEELARSVPLDSVDLDKADRFF